MLNRFTLLRVIGVRQLSLLLVCFSLAANACGQSGTSVKEPESPAAAVQAAVPEGVNYDAEKHLLTDDKFNFQANWPDMPKVNDRKIKTEFGEVNVRIYALSKGASTFMLMHTEYSDKFFLLRGADPETQPYEFLDFASRSSLASKKDAKRLVLKKIKLGEHHGMEQAFSFPSGQANNEIYPEGVVFQRAYLRNKAMDMIMVQMSKEAYQANSGEAKEMMLQFLESFRYTE